MVTYICLQVVKKRSWSNLPSFWFKKKRLPVCYSSPFRCCSVNVGKYSIFYPSPHLTNIAKVLVANWNPGETRFSIYSSPSFWHSNKQHHGSRGGRTDAGRGGWPAAPAATDLRLVPSGAGVRPGAGQAADPLPLLQPHLRRRRPAQARRHLREVLQEAQDLRLLETTPRWNRSVHLRAAQELWPPQCGTHCGIALSSDHESRGNDHIGECCATRGEYLAIHMSVGIL